MTVGSPRCDVLVVTARRIAEDDHGAGVRTARVVEVLAARYRVVVAEPAGEIPSSREDVIEFERGDLDLRFAASAASTEGASAWRAMAPALPRLEATQAKVVFWADAIVASAGMGRLLPNAVQVVEFANIESSRYRAMMLDGSVKRRAFAGLEAVKAVAWQQRVARRADAVVALALGDTRALHTSRPKLLVRNGVAGAAEAPTASSGTTVLAVGSWWYGPNRHGLRRFLRDDWPRVRAAVPGARLRVVGRGGEDLVATPIEGVEPVGFVDDLAEEYRGAALVLAPARSGGGSQLKLVGALAHGRVVVGPAFLARERFDGLPQGAFVTDDDMAASIVRLLGDNGQRGESEQRIRTWCLTSTWSRTTEPLTRFVDRALAAQAE